MGATGQDELEQLPILEQSIAAAELELRLLGDALQHLTEDCRAVTDQLTAAKRLKTVEAAATKQTEARFQNRLQQYWAHGQQLSEALATAAANQQQAAGSIRAQSDQSQQQLQRAQQTSRSMLADQERSLATILGKLAVEAAEEHSALAFGVAAVDECAEELSRAGRCVMS